MIRLEHLNLVVRDIPETLKFYQAVFPHWRVRETGAGDWFGKPRKWLHFGDDYQYLTLNDNGEGDNRDLQGHQTGLAHFGFVIENMDEVINRLATAGYPIGKDGAEERYRKNVYFMDPNGFEVEFVEYLSDLPEQRNLSS
ncbi:MAG: VOC family protein [Halioglobus sp.]